MRLDVFMCVPAIRLRAWFLCVALALLAAQPVRAALTIEVRSVADEFRRLSSMRLESGAELESKEIFDPPYGCLFWIRDPSGNRIEIIDERPLP